MKPFIKTPYNGVVHNRDYEVVSPVSLTVPDQTMTIPEIMSRFAAGLTPTNAKVPLWDGEDDILEGVDPRTLDISERYQLIESKKRELHDYYAQFKKPSPKAQAIVKPSTETVSPAPNPIP